MSQDRPEPCSICCHETRNALAGVVYFARQVKKRHPELATALLEASISRLDQQLARCAAPDGGKEPPPACVAKCC
jgi:hypothetical protein